MRRTEAITLGLLQGPTELLPVSSSAHVGLLADRLGLAGAERKELEVALHAGSALALARWPRRWGVLIAATAPPALAGLAFERVIEERLGRPRTIAAGLGLGAVALVAADRTPVRRVEPDLADGLWLGLAQALALIPGVSRSGATLTAARRRGFSRPDAVALSREVAMPVLAGATVLKGARLLQRRPPRETLVSLAAATVAATISTAAARRLGRLDTPLAAWAAYRVALAAAIVAADRRA